MVNVQAWTVKRGAQNPGWGSERLRLNEECPKKTFLLDYSYNGYLAEVKSQIVDMALNGSGIRDTG